MDVQGMQPLKNEEESDKNPSREKFYTGTNFIVLEMQITYFLDWRLPFL